MDDETDTLLVASSSPPKLDASSDADDLSYRQIRITKTAYSTFLAVILFLQTGHIRFAPLSSSLSTPRNDYLNPLLEKSPALPLPVSPKSVYRLADLLDLKATESGVSPYLPNLNSLALAAFRSSLTVEGAAHELFDEASVLYKDLRRAVLDFVKEKATEVTATTGWIEMMGRVERDEVPGERRSCWSY